MADTLKSLARGTCSSTPTTVYTVPAGKTTSVVSISVNNGNGSNVTVTITLDGVNLFTALILSPNGGVEWTGPEVLVETETIAISASTASGVTYHISGVETDG